MEKNQIPVTIDEITSEWLTGALTESGVLKDNSVQKIEYKIIGEETGFAGILARLSIEYTQPDGSLPASMIAKIPTQEAKTKMFVEALWNYEREIHMYEEFLDQLPIRTPKCYYSDYDPGKGEEWMKKVFGRYKSLPKPLLLPYFIYAGLRNVMLKKRNILLLEDLGHLEILQTLKGCSVDDIKMIMKPLGLAHAALWESPQLEKTWLLDYAEFPNLMSIMSGRWEPVIKKTFPDKVSPKMRKVFVWLKENSNELDAFTKTRPHTLIHTDLRLDNLFFDRQKNDIVALDWQSCTRSLGVFDPAFFMLCNCHTPLSPEQTEALVAIYHQGLVEGGVSNYSLDECLSDYTYGTLLAMRIWLIIMGGIQVEKDPKAKELLGVILDRIRPVLEAIDLDSISF